ncbi:MAG: DUF952 domain-containing protein [Aeromicrobium erythreum]
MILHLVEREVWASVDDEHRPASLDDEGFVHCSPDDAVTLAVANAFYADVLDRLVVLEVDEGRLAADVVWEDAAPAPPPGVGEDVRFPHVLGPIDRTAVVAVRELELVDGRAVAVVR